MRVRSVVALALATAVLAGCNGVRMPDPKVSGRDAEFLALAPQAEIPSDFQRYQVDYKTNEPVGSIIVNSHGHYLYYVQAGGKAIRYGVATGQDAMGWTGRAYVGSMQEWPRWMPPKDMLERWPHLQPHRRRRRSARRPRQSARLARAIPMAERRGFPISDPRHQRARENWPGRVVGLYPHARHRRDRPLQPGEGRNARGGRCRKSPRPSCADIVRRCIERSIPSHNDHFRMIAD